MTKVSRPKVPLSQAWMTSLRSPATNGITWMPYAAILSWKDLEIAPQTSVPTPSSTRRSTFCTGRVIRQDFPRLSDDLSGVGLDDVNPPRGVEHRRDPIVPVCKCRFHHPGSCASFLHRERAFAVPTRPHRNEPLKLL